MRQAPPIKHHLRSSDLFARTSKRAEGQKQTVEILSVRGDSVRRQCEGDCRAKRASQHSPSSARSAMLAVVFIDAIQLFNFSVTCVCSRWSMHSPWFGTPLSIPSQLLNDPLRSLIRPSLDAFVGGNTLWCHGRALLLAWTQGLWFLH